MITVIDLVKITKPYLTSTLVSNKSLNSIENLCAQLPPVFHSIYFEIRANEELRVDFTGMTSVWNFSKYFKEANIQKSDNLSIVRKWLKNGKMPMLSFEYDIIEYQIQKPFFLWTLHKGYIESINSNFNPSVSLNSIRDCLEYEDFLMSDDLISEINNSFYAMPKLAHILHVLNMNARGVKGVRLIISMPVFSCLSFLESINWKGNMGLLKELIDLITMFNFSISLQISYPAKIRSTVGIEVYPNDPKNIELNKKELSEFFSLLEKHKFLESNKIKDVLNWIGISNVDDNVIDWKMDVIRDVLVKFVFDEQTLPEAKFYLGANAIYKLF